MIRLAAPLAAMAVTFGMLAGTHVLGGTSVPTIKLPEPVIDEPLAQQSGQEKAVLSGGCFWGVQAVFEHVKGVTRVVSGYAGGSGDKASYEDVSTGTTGHAESVEITYDPSLISYGQLLKVYFSVAHDPTELNRQGPDQGTQYRSAVWYTNDSQKHVAQAYVDQLTQAKVFRHAIVTQLSPLPGFYAAEPYHQDYFVTHPDQPYIVINDRPKVEHLKSEWPALYKEYEGK